MGSQDLLLPQSRIYEYRMIGNPPPPALLYYDGKNLHHLAFLSSFSFASQQKKVNQNEKF